MKILLVEDDAVLAQALEQVLTDQHYTVNRVADGETGLAVAKNAQFDLILSDAMSIKLDRLHFCQQMRAQQTHQPPILLLTVQDTATHEVVGLDAGADGYILKPLDLEEVVQRVQTLVPEQGSHKSCQPPSALQLDPTSYRVSYQGRSLHLLPKEYKLLEFFLENRQRVFSQNAIAEYLWSLEDPAARAAVRALVKSLRQKLTTLGAPDLIETVYGLGYRLNPGELGEVEQPLDTDSQSTDHQFTGHQSTDHQSTDHQSTIHASQGSVLPSTPEKLSQVLGKLQSQFNDRVSFLETIVAALFRGELDGELLQKARHEVHSLSMALDNFEWGETLRIAQQIAQVLKSEGDLKAEANTLAALVQALRRSLAQAPTLLECPHPPPKLLRQAPRLLIVDDDRTLGAALALEASAWGMQADVALNIAEAKTAITRARPDVVLLDLSFQDSPGSGLGFLATLADCLPSIPILVFTAQGSFADRVKVARLGARGFLQKPMPSAQVLEAIAHVLQQSKTFEAKVLIVDDDPQTLHLLRTLLEPWGLNLTLLHDPEQFWDVLEQTAPDLLILDVEMPNLSGIDLCQVVRNDPRWSDLPILFLSPHSDAATVQQVFAAGGDDYVHKPIVEPELVARVLNRLERSHILRYMAETDALTGVTNRRKSTQELTRLLRLADRQQQPLCFAVLDIDHFKRVNDEQGHEAGDRVLAYLGDLLKRTFRSEDVVARWGGEEFVIGLYGATHQQGVIRLTEILDVFRSHKFQGTQGRSFQVNFSAGVAAYPDDGTTLQALYEAADRTLYRAKLAGRNRVLPSG